METMGMSIIRSSISIFLLIVTLNEVNSVRCLLPEYPLGGTYKTTRKYSGLLVDEYTAISYNCKENFELIGFPVIYCQENGTWSGRPKCLRTCKHLSSLTVDMRCEYQNAKTDCSSKKLDGFKMFATCKPLHRKVVGSKDEITCVNGAWDNALPQCELDCGEEKRYSGRPLVINGTAEIRLNSPWHVGVYMLVRKKYEQICGGTIISTKLIISAAHCFDPQNGKVHVQKYAVAAGKLYRDWDDDEITKYDYIQRKLIQKIYIHPKYNGFENYLQSDIAIMIVDIPFQFSLSVHAACMETNNFFIPANGTYGKLVGWGLTIEGNLSSSASNLQRADIPLVDERTCVDGVPPEFINFVKTLGTFCAGTTKEGATACDGDSGGGLLFNRTENQIQRWYLKGIVSVASKDDLSMTCASDSYTVFTNVSSHVEFSREIIEAYSDGCILPVQPKNGHYTVKDEKLEVGFIVPEYTMLLYECEDGFESDPDDKSFCLDGNWNATVSCNYDPQIGSRKKCVLPEYPEHGSYIVNGKREKPGKSVEPLTLIQYSCRDGYVVQGDADVHCKNGKWTSIVRCVDCGRYSENGSPGTPWTAGIYKKRGSQYRYHCGGTILSNRVVVSAAHCFSHSIGTMEENNYLVGVGKFFRKWNPREEYKNTHITYSAVSKIFIPDEYRSYELDFKYDIALLELNKTLKFSDFVRPVCFNFNEKQVEELPGTVGETTGWGFTTSRMTSKNPANLTTFAMTAVNFDTCRSEASPWLRRLITSDKICAYWVNNTDMCTNGKGDGLVFKMEDKNVDRWYLRGVSSTTEDDPTIPCSKYYSFFTDISLYKDFIENVINMY